MCGIIGFNWEDNNLLKSAMNEIEHRGPDDSGKFADKNISLGHRRLSIIDLSRAGKQPMSNENETIWIVFNGEIYNFQELKENLEKKHKFKSKTDTEVIIHLYEEEGVGCLKKLNGMFAFCIYDSKKNILFLARDRVGEKPLYYYFNKTKGEFMFCSEIKGILQNKDVKREVNLDAFLPYLSFRANSLEDTFFIGIKKLLPGTMLIYDLKKKTISKKRYWDLYYMPEKKTEDYFCQKLTQLFLDSIKKRIVSDVPYGAYLSGGVDSGTVIYFMNKFCQKTIETFSVGFEGGHNETLNSRFLAERLNTNHHELFIKEDSVKHLPQIVYQLDEPMADPTSIPVYFLSKYTKKFCTVVLTGEGSDEIFAGYPSYKFMKFHSSFISQLPFLVRKITPTIVRRTPKKLLNKGFSYSSELGEKGIERFSNFIISKNQSEQYLNIVAIFNEQEQKSLFSNNNLNLYDYYSKRYFRKLFSLNKCLKLDFKESLPEDLLMKLDKNTMAFSVEGRVPFLDHKIVEFSSKIPENLKLKGFIRDKFILRKMMKGRIPEQTRNRKKKYFFVPINNWFKNELLQLKEDLLSKNYIQKQNIFNYKYVEKINKDFKASKLFYSRQLWSLITFQIWYKQYIENERVKI